MNCLDDATLDDLVEGRLSHERLSAADAHLDACADCSAVVSALAQERGSGRRPSAARALEPGQSIGRFSIVRRIGGGAAGDVYAAHDRELGRDVALKLLRAGATAPAALIEERMRREARAMARLQHPNVVAVFDVGQEGGRVWLAMELVAGPTLRVFCAERRRGWREVRDVFAQAADGLAAAHEAGLVHRDFKPDNVIVGADGRVRVTDFGLARGAAWEAPAAGSPDPGADGALGATLTRTGALLGTPAYMAPEQLEGGEADARSDQFAFGVALHEALFGSRPFGGATVAELARATALGVPPRRELGGVPRWLESVARRAMAPSPRDRFASMRDLAAALGRDRSRARWMRGAVVAAALAATAVAAAAVVTGGDGARCSGEAEEVAAVWSAARAGRVRGAFVATGSPIAEPAVAGAVAALDAFAKRWAETQRATCRATHVAHRQSEALLDARTLCLERRLRAADALVSAFERADRELVAGASEAVLDLPAPETCASATSALDPRPTTAAAARDLAQLERDLDALRAATAAGRFAESIAPAREAAARAAAIGYRPSVGEAHLALATVLRRTGARAEAAREANLGLLAAEAAHDDRTAARGWLELAAAQGDGAAWTDADATVQHAAAAVARLGDPPDLAAAVHHAAGVVLTNLERFDDAARELDTALALREATLGREHVEVARTLTAMGNLARARGEHERDEVRRAALDRALELHGRARAIDERLLGARHPAVARHLHNEAGVLRLLGRAADALARYESALALEREALGEAHASVGLTTNSIGLVLLERGDVEGARQRFEAALAILERAGHAERASALQNLGIALARLGRHADAIARFEAARAVLVASLGESHPRVRALDDALRTSRESLQGPAPGPAPRPHPGAQTAPRPVPASAAAPPRPVPAGAYAPAQTLDP